MSLTYIFYTYSAALFLLSAIVIAKVITLDRRFHISEIIYCIIGVVLGSAVSAISRSNHNFFFQMFRDMMIIPFMFFYFYKMQSYSLKRAGILTSVSIYIALSTIQFYTLFYYRLFPDFYSHFIPRIRPGDSAITWIEFLHITLLLPCSVVTTVVFVKVFGKFRMMLKQSERLQTMLLCWAIVTAISTLFSMSYMRVNRIRFYISDWHFFPYDAVFTVVLVLFCVLIAYQNSKHEKRLEEERYQALHRYTHELEQQQAAMRKFRHDYRNILLSLDSFIEEEMWEDLKAYYNTEIKTASAVITSDEFALEALSKIKVNEVKSLFAAKLTVAQSMGIDATFEAHEEMNSIPVDSVSLVRMLGIILDNAIEALVELGYGALRVAYYKVDASTVFIVENTCQPTLKLREIEQPGFSTKGKGRGLGLKILSEIANACPNVTREMGIKGDVFTQRLTIFETV